MKKSHYKSGILLFITLLIVPCILTAQEVTKEFHKEYTTGATTTLDINNKYGDVVIQTWENNQVVIDVKVTVELPNRGEAEKLLAYIDVQFSEGQNLVSAKTVIDNKFNFRGWGSGSKKFSIDYNIKMPAAIALTLTNKYGNSELDDLTGLVNIDIKYGNLTAGKLTRGNVKPLSKLILAYGKGTIDETGWLDMNLRYCGSMDIGKSQAILLDSRYSKLTFGESSSLVGECKYDNLSIESINNLVLESGYTEVNIGVLTKKLKFNGSYGSFTTEDIPSGFESLDVGTRYSGVKLGISESANYRLDAKVSYGGLRYNEDNFNIRNRIIENNSIEVSGIMGKDESPSSNTIVSASYGSVRLN